MDNRLFVWGASPGSAGSFKKATQTRPQLQCWTSHLSNLYNNLAKPFSTVCTDPFLGQTSGPRPPDPKLDVESRLPTKIGKKISRNIFKFFQIFILKYLFRNIYFKIFI
jgi:hypothetical protein